MPKSLIHRSLPPLQALRSFEASARHLSFTEASRELHVTQAAVSQQIRTLENFLKCAMFIRTPRGLLLTSQGEAYFPIVQKHLDGLASGTVNLFGQSNQKPIVIRATSSFAIGWFGNHLEQLTKAFPDLSLRLMTFQWHHDGIEDYVDLEIRFGDGRWLDLDVEPIVSEEIFPVCCPKFLTASNAIERLATLGQHRLINVLANKEGWPEWLEAAGLNNIEIDPGLQLDSTVLAYQLASNGGGVAMGRTLLVDEYLRSGKLVIPFDIRLQTSETYYLVRPPHQRNRLNVDRICDWLKSAILRSQAEIQP